MDGSQKATLLSVETTISNDGGFLEIADTDIILVIPPKALEESKPQCLIRMRIILPGTFDEASASFSSNSSVCVELLPNDLTFKHPVELKLPHCLQLKEDVEYKGRIFMSHHKRDAEPKWEEVTDQQYLLDGRTCTIWLDRLGWVKYEVDDDIVEAKRIKVYTAAKAISASDDIAEIEVGYYLDLPGAGEILRLNPSFIVEQRKPYLFLREGNHPLKVSLQKILSHTWNYCTPEENPKEISFQIVASSTGYSCQFILRRDTKRSNIPTCIFKASQNANYLRLHICPKINPTLKLLQSTYFDPKVHHLQNVTLQEGESLMQNMKLEESQKKTSIQQQSTSSCDANTLKIEVFNEMLSELQAPFLVHKTNQSNQKIALIEELRTEMPNLTQGNKTIEEELDLELQIAGGLAIFGLREELFNPTPSTSEHPEYWNESQRFLSFVSWPTCHCQQPHALAEAGFFSTGVEDNTLCFYCGITLVNWVPEDEPWEEHARHSPLCQWLLQQIGQRFIDDVAKKYCNTEDLLDRSPKPIDERESLVNEDHLTSPFAKNPDYRSEATRRKTFTNWPTCPRQKPHILAQAGFFSLGIEDYVECFNCGVILSTWEPQDEPWEEHARHRPRCRWLLKQKGQRFIDKVTMKYHTLQNLHNVKTTWKDRGENSVNEDHGLHLLAKYPNYSFQGSRRASFSNWPVDQRQQLDTLTHAGFFSHGVGDRVTCSYCGKILVKWVPEDEPWETHARLSPDCKWLLEQKGQHFVEEVEKKYASKSTFPVVPSTSNPPEVEVKQNPSSQENQEKDNSFDENKQQANRETVEMTRNLGQIQINGASTQPEGLENSLEKSLCKICGDNDSTVVFYPCEHTSTCKDCADIIQTCPVCSTQINKKAQVVML